MSCIADDSSPEASPFQQLMVQYMQRTRNPDPDCLARAKQHQCSEWVTDEAVNALEQGARSRTTQMEHLAKPAKVLAGELTLSRAAHTAGHDMMRAAGTAKEVRLRNTM